MTRQRRRLPPAEYGLAVFKAIRVDIESSCDVEIELIHDHHGHDDLGVKVYRPDAETRAQVTSALVLPNHSVSKPA